MHVAVATHSDVAIVAAAPFVRTLWTHFHLLQREKVETLRARGSALYGASLNVLSFHEPRKLNDEHQRFLSAAGMLPVAEDPDVSRARALAFAREIAAVDNAKGWT